MRYGPAHKFWDLYAIPHVLQNPTAIFQGLEREDQHGGLCFAGVPPFIRREPKRWTSEPTPELDLVQLPPPVGMTFAVFVNVDYVIFAGGGSRWMLTIQDIRPTGNCVSQSVYGRFD